MKKKWFEWLGWVFPNHASLTVEQKQRLSAWQTLSYPPLKNPAEESRYVVVDVETSGLNLLEDRLISIGAVAVVGGRVMLADSYSAVLQQEKSSNRENILLHGIGGDAQRMGQPAADALLGFLEYMGKDPLVAFHVEFDETMIRRAMRRYLELNFKHAWVDLAYVMPALNPSRGAQYHSLDDWVNAFGIRIDARHDAIADALATAQLLQVALFMARKHAQASFAALRDLDKAQRWVSRIA